MNEMTEEIFASCKEEIAKALNHQKNEYQLLRAGRANPHILDKVFIDYYGVPTPIKNMASINCARSTHTCCSSLGSITSKKRVKGHCYG